MSHLRGEGRGQGCLFPVTLDDLVPGRSFVPGPQRVFPHPVKPLRFSSVFRLPGWAGGPMTARSKISSRTLLHWDHFRLFAVRFLQGKN
jgi:hypothetical protein